MNTAVREFVRALVLAVLPGLVAGVAALPSAADDASEIAFEIHPDLQPLALWLEQDDAVLRAMAGFELRRHVLPGVIHLAVDTLQRERDEVVLGCVLASLVGRPRADVVAEGGAMLPALLLRLVEHEHSVVRERAWIVLRIVRGDAAGAEVEEWRRWWLGARAELAAERARILAARTAAPPATPPAPAPGESATSPGTTTPDLYDYVAGLRRDGLEVCIVLDHTGSMAPVIGMATRRAASLVRRLAWLVPRFRAGLVTYDDAARMRVALTTDGDVLQAAFRKVTAAGGGDWEEGVDKGIALALRQEVLGWSQRAHRVLVVIGDAPPHAGDVAALLRRIRAAREDDLFHHPVIVNAVSTTPGGVDHFGAVAVAGGGVHLTLGNLRSLEEELVALVFGASFRDRVRPWLREIELLRRGTGR